MIIDHIEDRPASDWQRAEALDFIACCRICSSIATRE